MPANEPETHYLRESADIIYVQFAQNVPRGKQKSSLLHVDENTS